MSILEAIGVAARCEQLAEECSELAQAALKLARKIRGENPTPKTEAKCIECLIEETADVLVCIDQLRDIIPAKCVEGMMIEKEKRWRNRIREGGEHDAGEPDQKRLSQPIPLGSEETRRD